ncbi:MAG: putative quinol monooxygenase [Janthinobacterium lividum]
MSLFGTSHDSDTSTKISVIATTRAKSGHEDDVRKGFASLVEPSRKEPGCISYNVLEDAHYTGRFYTYEEWTSEDALHTHLHVNKASLDKVKAMLAEDLRISVLKPVE